MRETEKLNLYTEELKGNVKMWGFHNGVVGDSSLLGCDSVSLNE
jgi:hypothetical protein